MNRRRRSPQSNTKRKNDRGRTHGKRKRTTVEMALPSRKTGLSVEQKRTCDDYFDNMHDSKPEWS